MIIHGAKYLITLDEAIFMEDGLPYKTLYGTLYIHKFEDVFGFRAKGHADWFITIGKEKPTKEDTGFPILAGCRVNYAYRTDSEPQVLDINMVMTPTGPYYYSNIYIVKDEK